jgi:four helix bundle protein
MDTNDSTKTDQTPTDNADETRQSNPALALALAHEHRRAMTPRGSFPHEKLDAYRVALELADASTQIAKRIPRGHRSVADHLLRAASNTVLLMAEGANRRGIALKRQRFVESRGESAEVAAAGDLLNMLGIVSRDESDHLKHLAGRVSAMHTRLIGRIE